MRVPVPSIGLIFSSLRLSALLDLNSRFDNAIIINYVHMHKSIHTYVHLYGLKPHVHGHMYVYALNRLA